MIEFIFNNIPLVIIIIGGILSLLGRKENNKDTSTKPINPLPPVKKDIRKAEKTTEKKEKPFDVLKREMEEKLRQEVQKHLPTVTQQAKKIRPVTEEKKTEVAQTAQTTKQLQQEYTNLKTELSRKQAMASQPLPNRSAHKVVEGIIWSEILGPPRAKKPFRPNNKI